MKKRLEEQKKLKDIEEELKLEKRFQIARYFIKDMNNVMALFHITK